MKGPRSPVAFLPKPYHNRKIVRLPCIISRKNKQFFLLCKRLQSFHGFFINYYYKECFLMAINYLK
jgi:hypothetical protein